MSLHHCSACVSSSFCHHRFIRQKYNHNNSVFDFFFFWLNVLEHTERIYDSGVGKRRSLWGGIERNTGLRIFSLQSRGRERRRRWGIWLLSPHPQSVRGGFRKKGTKTWDAEITRDTNIEIPAWRCRARIMLGFFFIFFYFSFTEEILERLMWGERNTNERGIIWVFYTRLTSDCAAVE